MCLLASAARGDNRTRSTTRPDRGGRPLIPYTALGRQFGLLAGASEPGSSATERGAAAKRHTYVLSRLSRDHFVTNVSGGLPNMLLKLVEWAYV